jgi:hypothetical protein
MDSDQENPPSPNNIKVAAVIKKTAREEYAACRQGVFKNIIEYKRRFDARLDALTASGNTQPADPDIPMDFLYGLDNARCAEFKAKVVNDMQKGTLASLDDLNKMFVLASRRVVVKSGKDGGGGATFTTADKGFKPKGQDKANADKTAGEAAKNEGKAAKLAAWLEKMKCFICGEKGHPAKACPHKEKDCQAEGDPPMARLTLDLVCSTASCGRLHQKYEVCLDNGSQVNIIHPCLLTNLRASSRGFRGMSSASEMKRVGMLEGFFECQACDMCPTSILSMADVEDLYAVTYKQEDSITVHMDHRDIVFHHCDKMYVADFSDWVVEDSIRACTLCKKLSLVTVANKEGMYMHK